MTLSLVTVPVKLSCFIEHESTPHELELMSFRSRRYASMPSTSPLL